MTMTLTKRDNTIKSASVSQLIKQLKFWKQNRIKHHYFDNEMIDITITKLEKVVKYCNQNGDKNGWLTLK